MFVSQCVSASPGGVIKIQIAGPCLESSEPGGLKQGSRTCISSKFSSDDNAAGL